VEHIYFCEVNSKNGENSRTNEHCKSNSLMTVVNTFLPHCSLPDLISSVSF